MKKPIIIFIVMTILVLFLTCPFVFGAWDNTKPADATDYDVGIGEIRDNWDALEVVLGVDLINIPVTNYWVNVQESTYGAVGDGSTDDTTAINAAITAALAAGQAVYFPAGTYKVTSAITIAAGSKIVMFGDGPGITQIFQDTVNLNLFEIGGSSAATTGWYIANMSLATADGTANAGGSGYVFQLERMDGGLMENIHIPGCGSSSGTGGGIKMDNLITNTFKNVHISNSLADITGGRNTTSDAQTGFLFDDVIGNCNANTFIGCEIRAMIHCYLDTDSSTQGNIIIGGDLEADDTGYTIKLLGADFWRIQTFVENEEMLFTNCENILITNSVISVDSSSDTALELVACTNISIKDTIIGGVVTVDSDCLYCSFTNVRFAESSSYRNDSINTRLDNCFIGSATALRDDRQLSIVTRNHQIWEGDFETWDVTTADSAQPQGWTLQDSPLSNRESTIVHSGVYSLKIEASGTATEGVYFTAPDDFEAGWFSMSGFYYGTTLTTGPVFRMGTVESVSNVLQLSPTTNKWIPFEVSFYKASGATEKIWITTGTDGDVIYFDSIKIYAEFNPYGNAIALVDEGATPDVYNPGGPDVFIIEQSGATNVTDFDAFGGTIGLYDGQEITIIGNDATHVSTLKDGVPMNLTGANDFALTNVGDTVKLVYFQGVWYGVSESTNN